MTYGIVTLLFLANCVPLLTQRFPREIAGDVIRKYGADQVRLESTMLFSVDTTVPLFLPFNADRAYSRSVPERYVLLNAKDIWMPGGRAGWRPPPAGKVLFAAKHPRQLPSMQYHGYTPRQRAFLRAVDFSIQLIDTKSTDP